MKAERARAKPRAASTPTPSPARETSAKAPSEPFHDRKTEAAIDTVLRQATAMRPIHEAELARLDARLAAGGDLSDAQRKDLEYQREKTLRALSWSREEAAQRVAEDEASRGALFSADYARALAVTDGARCAQRALVALEAADPKTSPGAVARELANLFAAVADLFEIPGAASLVFPIPRPIRRGRRGRRSVLPKKQRPRWEWTQDFNVSRDAPNEHAILVTRTLRAVFEKKTIDKRSRTHLENRIIRHVEQMIAKGASPPDVAQHIVEMTSEESPHLAARLADAETALLACMLACKPLRPRNGKLAAAGKKDRSAVALRRAYDDAFNALCRAVGLPIVALKTREAERSRTGKNALQKSQK